VELEGAKLGEKDIKGRRVFRVALEHGALKVLHRVELAVQVADFGELVGERKTLLGQPAVRLPVGPEGAADPVPGLGKEVPGLELLFASDELDAQTVWKQGSDLRIVVSNKAVREKVEEEIGELEEAERDD
jgi:hypothetical protein